ncbi:Murein DD-endopeptidase MepM [Roseovarius sp. THAF27]|uniref:M23 family metallopeptidase n=1 Tax=Roseovarius TaxID=74030 RepID=UPI0012A80A8F|nr:MULTISPECIES: M23 family metallopeptidase [Roseovarius]MBY5989038.1 peptidoglycan DD-metalloendopeptidase family protein [Roseovarius atlanticus]MBY6124430.1 peptidoglycan DD-metalloendopeptidase family protein [Roseovarius atlanticus]MBY6148925.1 peptidoglycan DD-metalloendopeptidase family protein [Roseovarius atlanticus]QFT81285.1 Murein DD-endopeptidase MepM [Roseovarius sp. THAF27]QFT99580.1 Murein DD-endopeptidase MepM [Roseovarius sp. THAF8]
MRSRLLIKLNHFLERHFPERRVFLRSDTDTRFIRLRPATQLVAFLGASAIVAWAIIATAVLVMDSIGSGNFREQAKRDQRTYEARLNALEDERDKRAEEALAAQNRFNSALEQISVMQTELLSSETRRRELETGIEVIQSTLRRTMKDRDSARNEAEELAAAIENSGDTPLPGASGSTGEDPMVEFLSSQLAATAQERDQVTADAEDALLRADEMASQIQLMQDQNDQIFRQLEEAMSISVEPLDKMFSAAGMNPDNLIATVRSGYSGQGGPLMPLSFSTRGEEPSADARRANGILQGMDKLNLYRIAAQKAPFAMPVKSSFRYTSGFGMRWGRMHSGTDFAAPHGTPIYSTADGVVTHAGWQSGYGRLVKIQHEFGIETRYAHMSQLRVKKGQRVSRGDRIGDMGSTGRSTGTHLHYEVRVGGKAVNPMIYIKAARDVF